MSRIIFNHISMCVLRINTLSCCTSNSPLTAKTAKSTLKNDYEREYPQNNHFDQHAVQFLSSLLRVAITQRERKAEIEDNF